MGKKVLFWGRFDPGYSRNRVYISLFRELGWDVDFFFVKWFPKFGDVEACVRGLGRIPIPTENSISIPPGSWVSFCLKSLVCLL